MCPMIVAGINDHRIPQPVRRLLEDRRCLLVSSRSHLQRVVDQLPGFDDQRWISIVPLEDCLQAVGCVEHGRSVLFLLSGDPLFFGLGKRLKEQFPDRKIRFMPAVSYMQSCFAHAGLNWEDAEFCSLHGRPLHIIDRKLNSRKLFLFTDSSNAPDVIARYLIDRTGEHSHRYVVYVGECLGSEQQRFVSGSLEDVAEMSFAQPNSMILVDIHRAESFSGARFGLDDSDIEHSRGLITKREVRAAVLHRLQLPDCGVLWDIGAGSGSIGIEAARLFPSLSVYAVERQEEQRAHIRANKTHYRCMNLRIISGQAPDCFDMLPDPDRVFIGGSGGRLEDIISSLAQSLKGGLRVVATAVLEATAEKAPELLHSFGFEVDVSIIKTKRYRYPEKDPVSFNPIHIICGIRS